MPNFHKCFRFKSGGFKVMQNCCVNTLNDLTKIMNASVEDIKEIHGFGEVIANQFIIILQKENKEMVNKLRSILNIKGIEKSENQSLKGLTFVITGNVTHFKNRNELKERLNP